MTLWRDTGVALVDGMKAQRIRDLPIRWVVEFWHNSYPNRYRSTIIVPSPRSLP